ncbi:MAG: hypothetical protein AB7D01_03195 [Methanoculleus sp.]
MFSGLSEAEQEMLWYIYAHKAVFVSKLAPSSRPLGMTFDEAKEVAESLYGRGLITKGPVSGEYILRQQVAEALRAFRHPASLKRGFCDVSLLVLSYVPLGEEAALSAAEIKSRVLRDPSLRGRFVDVAREIQRLVRHKIVQRKLGPDHYYRYWRTQEALAIAPAREKDVREENAQTPAGLSIEVRAKLVPGPKVSELILATLPNSREKALTFRQIAERIGADVSHRTLTDNLTRLRRDGEVAMDGSTRPPVYWRRAPQGVKS